MLKVMIVDDETIAREGLRDLVNWGKLDMQVESTASNGEEALAYLTAHSIDILLTDIKMPRMDGLELLKALNERGILPICIIFSGFNEFRYAQKAIQYGVLSYLLKPIHLDELTDALQKAASLRRKGQTKISREEIMTFRMNTKAKADQITHAIGKAICSGDEELVRAESNRLFTIIHEGGYSPEIFRSYSFTCAYELSHIVSLFLGDNVSLLEDSDRLSLLASAQDELAIYHTLLDCIDDLCAYIYSLKQTNRRHIINDLIIIIQHRYSEEGLTLMQLAEELDITPNYLSTLFKKEIGKTFSEYLEDYRIECAAALLRESHLKVYEITSAVGYSDSRYFGKIFKEHFGKTPLEYRNMKYHS